MELSSAKSSKLVNALRYLLALPTGMLAFYIVGAVLLLISNWAYSSSVNTVTVSSIIFLKNISLATIFYIIVPKYKKIATVVLAGIMITLSGATAYIYIINNQEKLASLYINQILLWIAISVFVILKFNEKFKRRKKHN